MLKRKKIKTPPEIPLADFQRTERAARRAMLLHRSRMDYAPGEVRTLVRIMPEKKAWGLET